MRVPDGYEAGRAQGTILITRRDATPFVREAVREAGSLYAYARAHSRGVLCGRAEAHVIDAPGGEWVVRHYRRGGRIARVLGDRYPRIGSARPFRELRISEIARERGLPTPAVTAAVVYPAGLFYRGDLATERVPDAADLAAVTFGTARRPEAERLEAWHEAGRLVRTAAEAGLLHADLNLRNILVTWIAGRPRPHLLDLDRCRTVRRPGRRDVAALERRIRRSAEKLARQTGQPLAGELEALGDGLHG